jgi:hypothetical protein
MPVKNVKATENFICESRTTLKFAVICIKLKKVNKLPEDQGGANLFVVLIHTQHASSLVNPMPTIQTRMISTGTPARLKELILARLRIAKI